jgi:hypothetical protein
MLYPLDSDGEEWSTSFELLELVAEGHDRDPQLVMRRVGRLNFIHAEDDWSAIYSFANSQGKFAFYSAKGATVVWDPTHSRCAGWLLDGVADIMEVSPPTLMKGGSPLTPVLILDLLQ